MQCKAGMTTMQRPALSSRSFVAKRGGISCLSNTRALRDVRARRVVTIRADQNKAAPTDITVLVDPDDFKESSRKYLRSVFDFDRWEKHRSTGRYARHIIGLPSSRLVRGLAPPLLYVMALAAGVGAYETALHASMLPEGFPELILKSKEPFGLTSFALSLLLVFRTNASYGRWDEARKMWGLVLNRSRDFVRQALTWVPEERAELKDMFVRWTAAFSKCLMCHLRKGDDLDAELKNVGLLPHEIEAVKKSAHRPNYCLQVLGNLVRSSQVPIPAAIRMDENITSFEDCLGGCERILRTPIPLFYTRHTSRFMMIWLTLLPFTLWDTVGWTSIPLCGTIAFLLLGIEEIGVAIEEPFSVLALETISNTALTNVRELQATHDKGRGTGEDMSAAKMVAVSQANATFSNNGAGKVLAGSK